MTSAEDVVLHNLQMLDPASTGTIDCGILSAVLQRFGLRAGECARLLERFVTPEGLVLYRDFVADLFWQQPDLPTAAKAGEGHPQRALSVDYLASQLLKEVEAAGHSRAAPIYDLKATVILPKGRGLRCPRDGELHCAYVDAVPDGQAGCATVMLSYTWGYAVGDIVDALLQFCRDESLLCTNVFVWMCWSCINQHRVDRMAELGLTVPFANFQQTFADRVQMVGHVLALMAPWEMPRYLSRIWCVFEMFTAISLGSELVKVTVLMPPEQFDRLAATLKEDHSNWGQDKTSVSHIFDALAQVDVLKAKATIESDREQILQLIAQGLGAPVVNTTVSRYLKHWFVTAMEKLTWKTLRDTGLDAETRVQLCVPTCAFLREIGLSERGIDILHTALRLVPESSDIAGDLWRSLGSVFHKKGGVSDVDARRAFERALEIKKDKDGFAQSTQHAALLNSLGALLKRSGDLDAALEKLQQAREYYEGSGAIETRQGALALGNIGHCLFMKGSSEEAATNLQKGLSIFETLGLASHPDTALMLNTLGEVHMQQSKVDEACAVFQQAVQVRTQTGSLETRPGEIVKRNLSEALERKAALASAVKESQAWTPS